MDKFDNLVKELNDLQILQTSIEWEYSIPEDMWAEHFQDNMKQLAYDLDNDDHRHYSMSTSVIKIYDRILGIRHIDLVFSEMSMVEDCYHHLKFFEMREVQTVTYEEI